MSNRTLEGVDVWRRSINAVRHSEDDANWLKEYMYEKYPADVHGTFIRVERRSPEAWLIVGSWGHIR